MRRGHVATENFDGRADKKLNWFSAPCCTRTALRKVEQTDIGLDARVKNRTNKKFRPALPDHGQAASHVSANSNPRENTSRRYSTPLARAFSWLPLAHTDSIAAADEGGMRCGGG